LGVKNKEENMRKIVYGVGISLDGYIARRDGAVDFLFMPKDYSMGPFFKTVDVGIMGRKTYDDAMKMTGGKFDGQGLDCYVMSRTLEPGKRNGARFVNEDVAKLVAGLRKKKGKNIWLMGGGELAGEFLKLDLVDEIHLGIVPVLLGEGRPLFPAGFPEREFALIENKSYGLGLVVLKYERVRGKIAAKGKKKR
jgi:dihydrofolate reductase